MAKVFVTGSADGLGLLTAKTLAAQGHDVTVHARNIERARQLSQLMPAAKNVLTGDLSSIEETKSLALKANAMGTFDAVVHNAGVYRIPKNSLGAEGLPILFTVNSLAPYILTAMMNRPSRLIYLTSGMHSQGNADISRLSTDAGKGKWDISYSDTKLHDVILCMAIARKWSDVFANAVNPGWVPTKMGGAGAPDPLEDGYATQTWLAVSSDEEAKVSGCYFHHKKKARHLSAADNIELQEEFLGICKDLTGVSLRA